MGHRRTKPQLCKDCGSEKIRSTNNKFKCMSEDCIAKRKAYMKEYSKKHWNENKEAIKEQRQNWSPERKEANDVYMAQYRANHKDEHREWGIRHRAENSEAINAQRREHYQENKEVIGNRQKEYYQKNKDERLAYAKEFRDERMAPYYKMWDSIVQRTSNENHHSSHRYVDRNIQMYQSWRQSYKVFEEYIDTHLGVKPGPEYSIDRIDNNKGYEPGNLKWSTPLEQNNNRWNSSKYLSAASDDSPIYYPFGNLTTLKEFAEKVGLPLSVTKYRYAENWDAEYILNKPKDNRRYKYKYHKYPGHWFSTREIQLISGHPYKTIINRLIRLGWSVERTIETSL